MKINIQVYEHTTIKEDDTKKRSICDWLQKCPKIYGQDITCLYCPFVDNTKKLKHNQALNEIRKYED